MLLSRQKKWLWTDALMLVYSITDQKSFDEIQLRSSQPHRPIQAENRRHRLREQIGSRTRTTGDQAEGTVLAETLKCMFVECSASEGYTKVAEAFHELYREVIKKRRNDNRRMSLSPRPLRALGKDFRRNSSKNVLFTTGN